jgi:ElaB/YqjD/DUF883 family membrane-anchored ribosome-binding protein
MDFDETLLRLVEGQGRIEQLAKSTNERLDKALPFLQDEHNKLEDRVTDVEKKVWYSTGVGSGIGALLGIIGTFWTFKK